MNGLDYGQRIAPLLRVQQFAISYGGAAFSQMLPANPHRFALMTGGWYAANNHVQFSIVQPTTSAGFRDCSNFGVQAIFRYCDLGSLIWLPVWGRSIDAAANSGVAYEWTLPREGWEIIWKQSLTLSSVG